ncbi:MAG TPA: glycosyltransferase, partial [Lachnospiraceae bacterium]|nr:glycosyltransferase [Lachnospiraceae bacterium]
LGFVYAVWAVVNKFTNPAAPMGWTSTVIIQLVLGGMILFVLGLLGEYVGRMYISMNNAPQYVIKTMIGYEKTEVSNGRDNYNEK